MTAHEEMKAVAERFLKEGKLEFTAGDIFKALKKKKSRYKERTIRAEMLRCCLNCPREGETPHDYFKRVGTRGREYTYRLL